jgi:putative ABC transport system ATP-binding protein
VLKRWPERVPRVVAMSPTVTQGAPVAIEDIHHRYTASGPEVLCGVTLRIVAGEFVALTGPSGSGKTTLLHLLAALHQPTAGRVVVAGVDAHALRGSALAAFRRERVGLIFQRFHLLPGLTALENVMAPLLPYRPAGELRARARGLLARVRMERHAAALPGTLSGGEQQRVAIARALIAGPQLLLADEPTGSLDRTNGAAVMELLQELQAAGSMTLIVATHDPQVAARASRSLRIAEGSIVEGE